MATQSSIPAGIIPWTEEPGGLESMASQRAGQDKVHMHASEVIFYKMNTYESWIIMVK